MNQKEKSTSPRRPRLITGMCTTIYLLLAVVANLAMEVAAAFTAPVPAFSPLASHRTRMLPAQSTVAALFDSNLPDAHHLPGDHHAEIYPSNNGGKEGALDDEGKNGRPINNDGAMMTTNTNNPTPVLISWLQELTKEPATSMAGTASILALSWLLLLTPMSASAAMSGGRMGGSFSSSSSSSFSRPSVTRTMPSTRSYRGSYSRGYSSGFTSGYLMRPGFTAVSPFYSPFYSPFTAPTRHYVYGGPGVISYSNFSDLIVLGGIGFLIWAAIQSARMASTLGDGGGLFSSDDITFPWVSGGDSMSALGAGTSVAKISVALEVPDRDDRRSILSVLDRLAQTARTDGRVGIQNLTSQVALELLRRKASIVSAHTGHVHFGDRSRAQREYNSLAVRERGKFEQETVSKYGGVDYSSPRGPRAAAETATSPKATMVVVTLLLAIDGDSTKLPAVRSVRDVENALGKIASDAKVDDCLQSAEILWTPEDRGETLSLRDVVADYPELRTL